jgi:hypothetical protein
MIEIIVTQYEKHQENDIVLDSFHCYREIDAARWVKDSWDNVCDDMFGKNPIIIKKLANEIKKIGYVVIDTPYCDDAQITWTIIKH